MPRPSLLRRIYRMRPLPAALLSLPAVLLVAMYAWRSYSRLDSFRRDSREEAPFTLDTFQIALFDTVRNDIRATLVHPPPADSPLESYAFQFKRGDWAMLERSAAVKDDRPYVDADLEYRKRVYPVELRLRGNRYWHTELPQKSMKVKLEKGELLNGHRVFNLINDPTPLVMGEHLILELARDLDVLTPRSGFSRVRINSKDMGVFLYETEPDESLLRDAHRIPGGIYASDLPSSAKTEQLWMGPEHWEKVASRTDKERDETDFTELVHFLDRVANASFAEFAEFARKDIDLERFAAVDVLDVAFGGDQHDFRENHKYYFDPYRGRWEPIAWNFRGFQSDPKFNLVENPVLLRLKMLPEYLGLRDRRLYQFLVGEGAPSQVRERGTRILRELTRDLESDPHWDAYRLLPRVDRFHRRMVRPMNLSRAVLVFDSELTTYRNRHAQLMFELEKNPLYSDVGVTRVVEPPAVPAGADALLVVARYRTPVEIVIDGRAGVALEEVQVKFVGECEDPRLEWWADGRRFGGPSHGSFVEFSHPLPLYPTVSLAEHPTPNARRGTVQSELSPVSYSFELESSCRPSEVTVIGRHLATESQVRGRPVPEEVRARLLTGRPGPDAVPRLVAGQRTPHPWEFLDPLPEQVTLGPGEVSVPVTRVYRRHQSVTVEPGTKLLMGKGASLVFLGSVAFAGTRQAPIVVQAANHEPWGGVVIQGPHSSGSSLRHVTMSGGSVPYSERTEWPGMVNIHDNERITLDDCRFGSNQGKGDLIHVAYSKQLAVQDIEISNTEQDALDLEFSDGSLSRLSIVNVGDDALDLMGASIQLQDSVLLGIQGNGVSAGEETTIQVRNTLIADAKVGLLAKNASEASLMGSVLYRNDLGVRLYTRTVRYEGDSHVRANVLFVVDSKKKPIQRDSSDRDRLDQGRVLENLPQRGLVDNLLHNVLQLQSWKDLPGFIEARRREAVL